MHLPQLGHREIGIGKDNAVAAIHPERKRKPASRSRPIALLLVRAYTAGSDRCSGLTGWPIDKSAMIFEVDVRRSGSGSAFALGAHPESAGQHGTTRGLQVTPAQSHYRTFSQHRTSGHHRLPSLAWLENNRNKNNKGCLAPPGRLPGSAGRMTALLRGAYNERKKFNRACWSDDDSISKLETTLLASEPLLA